MRLGAATCHCWQQCCCSSSERPLCWWEHARLAGVQRVVYLQCMLWQLLLGLQSAIVCEFHQSMQVSRMLTGAVSRLPSAVCLCAAISVPAFLGCMSLCEPGYAAGIACHVVFACVHISGRCVDGIACSAAAAVVADPCCRLYMLPVWRLQSCTPCLCSSYTFGLAAVTIWIWLLLHVYEAATLCLWGVGVSLMSPTYWLCGNIHTSRSLPCLSVCFDRQFM